MAALDIFFRPSFLTPVLLVIVYALYSRVQSNKCIPKGIPWYNQDERVKKAKSAPEMLKALNENVTRSQVPGGVGLTRDLSSSTQTKVRNTSSLPAHLNP